MSASNVSRWEHEHWIHAARGEASAATLRADFLAFWSTVSTQTLAALLMWAHSGWGQSKEHQRPPVDVSTVNVLSAAVLYQVQAHLLRQDQRPLPKIVIDAHLGATRLLLENFPYYDEEIPDLKYCDECLWQYLIDCAAGLPDEEALQWFEKYKRPFSCQKHLGALKEILKRLPVSTPELGESEWSLSSLEANSNIMKISKLVLPLKVRLLLPSLLIPGFVWSAASPATPEPGMALTLRPQLTEMVPGPIDSSGSPPPPLTPATPAKPPPAKASSETAPKAPPSSNQDPPDAELLPEKPRVAPTPTVLTHSGSKPEEKSPRTPPPSPRASHESGISRDSKTPPNPPQQGVKGDSRGAGGGKTKGTKREMKQLAQDLSVQLQSRGKACSAGGHVFTVEEGKGLLIDGQPPSIKHIESMRLALKECQG